MALFLTTKFKSRRSGQKWWNKRYKDLYGGEEQKPHFAEAFRLFLLEAESGNALAMHDLGRMFTDGLGREINLSAAQEWYAKALAAFLKEEQSAEEKQRPYLQYRIGKMFAAGLGTEHKVNCPEGTRLHHWIRLHWIRHVWIWYMQLLTAQI